MTARRLTSREDGVGTFGSILGGVIVLTLVLLATHVLLALQRRSVVNAVAFDVARSVARNDAMTVAEAQARARDLLHDDEATIEWLSVADDDIGLRITTRSPMLVTIGPLADLAIITRTVHVRRELLRRTP